MQHNEELIIWALEKADLAIKAAKDNIELKNFDASQNRIYYAIFYAVNALAYKYNYTTSKHNQLMGWFNKKFVYEDKTFDEYMLEIYKRAFLSRQKSDYEILFFTSQEDLEITLKEAVFFVSKIKEFLNNM